jgi:hypothetical protein
MSSKNSTVQDPLDGASMHPDTATALAFFRRLADSGSWSSVTFKLEAGRVVHVRQEVNYKPSELSGFPRKVASEQFRNTRQ